MEVENEFKVGTNKTNVREREEREAERKRESEIDNRIV